MSASTTASYPFVQCLCASPDHAADLSRPGESHLRVDSLSTSPLTPDHCVSFRHDVFPRAHILHSSLPAPHARSLTALQVSSLHCEPPSGSHALHHRPPPPPPPLDVSARLRCAFPQSSADLHAVLFHHCRLSCTQFTFILRLRASAEVPCFAPSYNSSPHGTHSIGSQSLFPLRLNHFRVSCPHYLAIPFHTVSNLCASVQLRRPARPTVVESFSCLLHIHRSPFSSATLRVATIALPLPSGHPPVPSPHGKQLRALSGASPHLSVFRLQCPSFPDSRPPRSSLSRPLQLVRAPDRTSPANPAEWSPTTW